MRLAFSYSADIRKNVSRTGYVAHDTMGTRSPIEAMSNIMKLNSNELLKLGELFRRVATFVLDREKGVSPPRLIWR
jgi:hypothetical protein